MSGTLKREGSWYPWLNSWNVHVSSPSVVCTLSNLHHYEFQLIELNKSLWFWWVNELSYTELNKSLWSVSLVLTSWLLYCLFYPKPKWSICNESNWRGYLIQFSIFPVSRYPVITLFPLNDWDSFECRVSSEMHEVVTCKLVFRKVWLVKWSIDRLLHTGNFAISG